jgi:hypothetical protein
MLIARHPGLAEIEKRIGVPSLDDILAERDKLADEWKALHAVYGPNGTAKEKLENLYAVIAADVREHADEGARGGRHEAHRRHDRGSGAP